MLNKIYNAIHRRLKKKIEKIKTQPQIIKSRLNGSHIFTHISAFNYGNAGDIILPVVLRDLFNKNFSLKKWKLFHVSKTVNSKLVHTFNSSDAIIIGGGGLFLKDTNKNIYSGWQWSCSVKSLNEINKPIVMFAVGYNRFRQQAEFDPIFTEHLNLFVKKAKFIGLRNNGSIEKIKEYLTSNDLKNKIVFQPCMTTLLSKIYPNLTDYRAKDNFIAINCAFDREELRTFTEDVKINIAKVFKKLSNFIELKYYSHMNTDNTILKYFDDFGVNYKLIEFKNPREMIIEYSKPRLVVGMRGHSQMIPFGCLTPIYSIISHDKMQWFLDDIKHSDWGLDVLDKSFSKKLETGILKNYNEYLQRIEEIESAQKELWKITKNNLRDISHSL